MKFQLEKTQGHIVRGWEAEGIRIGERLITGSVVLTATEVIEGWTDAGAEALQHQDFEAILELAPDIILLGTGGRLEFPSAQLMSYVVSRGFGLEVMDTPAACRTFNVLRHEERAVALAVLAPPGREAAGR